MTQKRGKTRHGTCTGDDRQSIEMTWSVKCQDGERWARGEEKNCYFCSRQCGTWVVGRQVAGGDPGQPGYLP